MEYTGTMDDFVAQIERHRNEFYRHIHRTVWDSGVADDVFQTAVLAAWENLDQFIPGTNFRAWMYRIITNKCFVANRDIRRTPQPLDETPEREFAALEDESGYGDVLTDPEAFLEQCGDEVIMAMRELSTAERSCILLRSAHKFSYKEIAEIVDIPLGTVVTHLARGRAKLRRQLVRYASDRGFVRKKAHLHLLETNEDTGRSGQKRQGTAS